MSAPLEIELKWLLEDPAGVDRLKKHLGAPQKEQAQTNYYFDAHNLWSELLFSFRLREMGQRWKLTVKGPSRPVEQAVSREEWECEIPPAQAHEALTSPQGPSALLLELQTHFPDMQLPDVLRHSKPELTFKMYTLRQVFRLDDTHVLELDETHYPDGVKFELEAEAQSLEELPSLQHRVEGLLTKTANAIQPSLMPKMVRFREALRKASAPS